MPSVTIGIYLTDDEFIKYIKYKEKHSKEFSRDVKKFVSDLIAN